MHTGASHIPIIPLAANAAKGIFFLMPIFQRRNNFRTAARFDFGGSQ